MDSARKSAGPSRIVPPSAEGTRTGINSVCMLLARPLCAGLIDVILFSLMDTVIKGAHSPALTLVIIKGRILRR